MSEPNFHNIKFFTDNLLAIETRKTQTLMSKPIYLALPIVELRRTVMYEFSYDYVKLRYGEKVRLCNVDADSFFFSVRTDAIYNDTTENVKTRFDTSNYESDTPLPEGRNIKVIGLMKDELERKIMKNITYLLKKIALSAKNDKRTQSIDSIETKEYGT